MMKQNHLICVGWLGVILVIAAALCNILEPMHCEAFNSQHSEEWQSRTDSTVLLLQQTDTEGGTVTPEAGVHYFGLNEEVTLTATPKPGYYFVYWIGDVSDPTASRTIVYLDTPKIVLAVFERSKYEFAVDEKIQATLGAGGRLYPGAADYSRGGSSGGGGRRTKRPEPSPTPTPEPPGPTPPEPEPPDEFPIPEHTPEPATIFLLGLGGLLFIGKRPKR